LAELLVKYPNKFIGAVACLPLNDIDMALKETERAIGQLGLKGIQVFASVYGEQLDDPKFKPLYEKMSKYDLPIWIHPSSDDTLDEPVFGWPFSTTWAMKSLVSAGIFSDYPTIKIITHHCGSLAPYFEGRIRWLYPQGFKMDDPGRTRVEHFSKFYADTALYGTVSALMCGYDFFGADHLLFGTDSPSGPQYGLTGETIRSIEHMNIPDTDKEKIFNQNAVKLLKMAI
ncbi:amidohydrolase family protein, partial [Chloroflexota bacterium]